jgi:hypothetical protein
LVVLGFWIQGFAFAKQILYHFCHVSSHFLICLLRR